MTIVKYNTEPKEIYFKAYNELSKVEDAIKLLKEENIPFLQVSVLGKVSQFKSDKAIKSSKDIAIVKLYWKDLLCKTVNFGTFYNNESGSIFIVGALVSTFLHKINGKSLATLSSGSYGIFRGIGLSDIQATTYIKLLNNGHYLLILRKNKNEVDIF